MVVDIVFGIDKGVVGCCVDFDGNLARDLPQAILGAIVIGAVLKLIDVRGMIELRQKSTTHLLVGVVTLVATLATAPHVEYGVMIGIAMSLVLERLTRQPLSEPAPVREPVGN